MTERGPDAGVWTLEGDPACDHPERTHLGADGRGNAYYRCGECDGVVVEADRAPTTHQRPDDGAVDAGPTRDIGSRLHLEGIDGLAGPYGGSGPSPFASNEPAFRQRLRELGVLLRRLGTRLVWR